jgi:hypothetical protein
MEGLVKVEAVEQEVLVNMAPEEQPVMQLQLVGVDRGILGMSLFTVLGIPRDLILVVDLRMLFPEKQVELKPHH